MPNGYLAEINEASRGLRSLNGAKPKHYGDLVITNIADVPVENVEWIWRGFIARGTLHLYAGESGIGKTKTLVNLMAVISRGGVFPATAKRCTEGRVVYVSAEDSITHTIKPQFIACNGNEENFDVISSAKRDDTPLTLQDLMDQLTGYVFDNEVVAIVIDPATALMPDGFDNNSVTSVRKVLHQIRAFAETTNCAVIAVTHLTKGTHTRSVHRILGSGGWVAAPRIVLGAIEKDGEYLFGKWKANITDRSGVYRYEMTEKQITGLDEPTTYIEWLDDETESDKELADYDEVSADSHGQRGDEALLVMEEYMDEGRYFRKENVIREVQKRVRISERQVQRLALEVLKVESSRENVQNGKALWRIPLVPFHLRGMSQPKL